MEENRILSSERDDLTQQIARDEEAMTSTIQLLKHTIEQKQHHFDNRSTHNIETKDLNQQSQASSKQMIKELKIEKETTAQPTVKTSAQPTSEIKKQSSAQPISDTVNELEIEKRTSAQPNSITVKEPEAEKQNSSWLTKHVNKAIGLLTPKSQVSIALEGSSHTT